MNTPNAVSTEQSSHSVAACTTHCPSQLTLEQLAFGFHSLLSSTLEVRPISPLIILIYLTRPSNRIMQLKSLVNAVALALFAASAHAQAPAGIYSIINGGATEPLAITFDSQGQALTVTTEDVTSTKKLVLYLYLLLIINFF